MSELSFPEKIVGPIRQPGRYGTRIARKYRAGQMLLRELCRARLVGIKDIRSGNRSAHIWRVKREFCEIARANGLGSVITGYILNLDASTVRYHRSSDIRAGKRKRYSNGRRRKRTSGAGHGGDQGAGGGG